jgi:transcriptional regulator of arginine metabolism
MPKTRDDQLHRRKQILNILNDNHVRIENLDHLLAHLMERGIEASKSSVSRDLKELSIIRVNGRYQIPTWERDDKALQRVDDFIKKVIPAGPYVTVIPCYAGTGRAVAAALKTQDWAEISGMVADDDTLIVFTVNNYDQKMLLGKLKRILDPDVMRRQAAPFL